VILFPSQNQRDLRVWVLDKHLRIAVQVGYFSKSLFSIALSTSLALVPHQVAWIEGRACFLCRSAHYYMECLTLRDKHEHNWYLYDRYWLITAVLIRAAEF
jgi:hypothetical protein